MKQTLLLIITLCLFASCKKETEPCQPLTYTYNTQETIYPSDYVMTYPESWWEFDNDSTFSCNSWMNAVEKNISKSSTGCTITHNNVRLTTESPSVFKRIVGPNLMINMGDDRSTVYLPIIDTNVGAFHEIEYGGGEGKYSFTVTHSTETLERLNSMTIGQNTFYDVLHIKETRQSYYHSQGSSANPYYDHFWFAKDVGLIKYSKGIDNIIIDEGEFLNYHIGPH